MSDFSQIEQLINICMLPLCFLLPQSGRARYYFAVTHNLILEVCLFMSPFFRALDAGWEQALQWMTAPYRVFCSVVLLFFCWPLLLLAFWAYVGCGLWMRMSNTEELREDREDDDNDEDAEDDASEYDYSDDDDGPENEHQPEPVALQQRGGAGRRLDQRRRRRAQRAEHRRQVLEQLRRPRRQPGGQADRRDDCQQDESSPECEREEAHWPPAAAAHDSGVDRAPAMAFDIDTQENDANAPGSPFEKGVEAAEEEVVEQRRSSHWKGELDLTDHKPLGECPHVADLHSRQPDEVSRY